LEPSEVERLLDDAFELGVTAFDTAPVYGRGLAEQRLGSWLERRAVRSRVTIIDKGCHPQEGRARVDPGALEEDVQRSLCNLRVDTIDLYLLHRDATERPVGEIIDALNGQLRSGWIRAFGASNWRLSRILEADEFARRNGLVSFSVSSPGFSLARAEKTWPGCVALGLPDDAAELGGYRAAGIPLVLWSPLAGGFLGRDDPPKGPLDWQAERAREFYDTKVNRARRERARWLAVNRGVGLAPLALAYAFSIARQVSLVLGCRTRAELVECTEATGLSLSAAEARWLELGSGSPPNDD
jgi:aryl-alcohol dehydrogenase-like predicted oxidoreductase